MIRQIGVLIVCCELVACGSRTTSNQYIESAEAYLASNQLDEAVIELKNAVKVDPESARARWVLAQTYFELGDLPSAEKEVRRAHSAGMTDERVLPLLAQILLSLGKHEELQALEPASLAPEGAAVVLAAQGLSMLSDAKLRQANAKVDEALSLDARSSFALVARARLSFIRYAASSNETRLQRALANNRGFAEEIGLYGKSTKDGELSVADSSAEPATVSYASRLREARARIEREREMSEREHIELLVADAPQQLALVRDQLAQAFEVDQDYGPAWELLGDVEWSQDEMEKAEAALSRALELRPNNINYRFKRAMIRVQGRQIGLADADVQILKERFPRHPGVAYVQGLLELERNDPATAKTSFEYAALMPYRYPLALLYLATINLNAGAEEQARSYTAQFLKFEPDSVVGAKLAASMEIRVGDTARAEQLLRPVVAASERDIGALNLLAIALMAQGRTEEGLDLLARVVKQLPDSPAALTRLAAGFLDAGQQGVGQKYLQQAVKLEPQYQQAGVLLVLSFLERRDFAAAEQQAVAFFERHPDSVAAPMLLARVQSAAGLRKQAEATLQSALEKSPGEPDLSEQIAELAIGRKDYTAARTYYAAVLDRYPDHLQTLMLSARLDALQDREASMVATLEQAVAAHPGATEPRLILARYLLESDDSASALALLEKFSEVQREQPDVLQLLGAAQLDQGDFSAARRSLERLADMQPGNASARYSLARAYAGLEDYQGMKRQLEKALNLDPAHLGARLALARQLLAEQNLSAAQEHIVVLERDWPDHPAVKSATTQLSALQNREGEDLAALRSEFEADPSQAGMLRLAQALDGSGDAPGTLRLMQTWVREYPEDIVSRFGLAELHQKYGRIDQAIEQYEAIIALDRTSVGALNNLAWYLRERDPVAALGYAERAVAAQPVPTILDTYAAVLLENGQFGDAKAAIEQALELAPEDSTLLYRLAVITRRSGNTAGAVAILEDLVSQNETFAAQRDAEALLATLKN